MTRRITYTLLNPTGNITLLAETPVSEESQPLVAKALMAREPDTEQVGFLYPVEEGIGLRMAGGEFCGNASMSAAVLYMKREGRESGSVTVTVSGTPEPVEVDVLASSDSVWQGTVRMPRPISVEQRKLSDGRRLPVVRFPGITHVILEEDMDRKEAERLARLWCSELEADGLGLMFLNRNQKTLKPLVWVPAAETLFWESSCASGTTAAGAYLAKELGRPVRLPLAQAGGILTIEAEPEGALFLSGTVRIITRAVDVAL